VKLLPLAAAAVLLFVACTADPLPGYRAATPDERASILEAVEEYYDILDVALVSGDVGPLYVRHPKLAEGAVPQRGINREGFTMRLPSIRDHLVREAHVDIQFYEPFRAYLKERAAVAYSRGLFTWTYANGAATKGELRVRFELARRDDRWFIEQTDELVLGEGTPPPTPR
jgi:hypothetical protein